MSQNWTELSKTLGIEVITNNPDECEIELSTAGLRQPHGLLHGGMNGVVVEHAGSLLAQANAPIGKVAVGLELSVSHLKANASGIMRARASVVKCGQTIFVSNVDVTDAEGKLTASGRLTCVYMTP
ncbi:uncharacterized protein (TIGR00369 family) [Trueperella bonasi]|uniref:Uncharacterized protein (TIGR00369 family) n=1 Tax=Trueperella bonasi TaxID=312286 RepID=A0ABT9NF78_9ACTO|nr:PaaI family thioesterase [Trueperella bonasi]MDP9805503.1 uncharacterized protein (TIGR00369 family) [Trueperella bonasi]